MFFDVVYQLHSASIYWVHLHCGCLTLMPLMWWEGCVRNACENHAAFFSKFYLPFRQKILDLEASMNRQTHLFVHFSLLVWRSTIGPPRPPFFKCCAGCCSGPSIPLPYLLTKAMRSDNGLLSLMIPLAVAVGGLWQNSLSLLPFLAT